MDDGQNRIWCNICNVALNSKSQADQHHVGRVHLTKLKQHGLMDASDQNSAANNSSLGLSWCSVCNFNLDPQTSNEHFECRTHLNRCLQKGIGISLVPGSGIKEGERSSTWCSVCNHALESVAQAEEHYESRAHLNKCLQRGVGIPLTYAVSAPCAHPPTGPRFSQAGGATSPGTSGFPPPGGASFRPGIAGAQHKPRPRLQFPPNNRPTTVGGAKKFPIQPFIRGQGAQSNPRMSGPFGGGGGGGGGGYSQDRLTDSFSQYDASWQQNQPTGKTSWPYCETCDQSFPTVGALSQHCNSSGHMEMKMMKQTQYHSGQSQGLGGDQSRFYQGAAGHVRSQAPNQGQYYGGQGGAQQDPYRGGANTQNQGGHYAAKEWRPFNRNSQFLS